MSIKDGTTVNCLLLLFLCHHRQQFQPPAFFNNLVTALMTKKIFRGCKIENKICEFTQLLLNPDLSLTFFSNNRY
jgi:hypothetical protein